MKMIRKANVSFSIALDRSRLWSWSISESKLFTRNWISQSWNREGAWSVSWLGGRICYYHWLGR